jgi:ABC-2 type transport system ATP-binding protein
VTLIETSHLTKDFGSVRAVDDLSFAIGEGKIVGFLGPNGSGKTTTLRSLLGLVTPSSGDARIRGVSYAEISDPLREVGAMLEASAHPARSARGHLRVLAAEAGLPKQRIEEVLDLVDLVDAGDRKVGGFSLGMRQRLGLAGALLGDPAILVLDEPANGLDPEGIRWLRGFLRGLASEGRTILISSHVLAEVAETVDEVVVINDGRLVTHAPLQDLTSRPAGGRVRLRTPDLARFEVVARDCGLQVTEKNGSSVTVSGSDREAIGQLAFDHRIVLHELVSEGPSLEEAFLAMTDTTQEVSS